MLISLFCLTVKVDEQYEGVDITISGDIATTVSSIHFALCRGYVWNEIISALVDVRLK